MNGIDGDAKEFNCGAWASLFFCYQWYAKFFAGRLQSVQISAALFRVRGTQSGKIIQIVNRLANELVRYQFPIVPTYKMIALPLVRICTG